jgi:hypothetical protein
MIKYALACKRGHTFESWFQSSAAYDKQATRALVACPICGSTKVAKEIMAPALTRTRKRAPSPPEAVTAPSTGPSATPPVPTPFPGEDKTPVAMISPQEIEFRKKLKELRDHLTRNADYVGPKFPEEARKMHYGEAEHRSIYGEASPDDAKALADEGIEFHPLPVLPDERN